MRVLTADGSYHTPKTTAAASLAGPAQPITQAWNEIRLAPLGGIVQAASYRLIYRRNPWVYACVLLLARSLARLPVKTYELDAGGERQRVRGDLPGSDPTVPGGAQLDRLLHLPAPRTSAWSLRFATWVDRMIYGNALWIPERDRGTGTVQAIRRAPWRTVTVFPAADGITPFVYRVQPTHSTRPVDYAPGDVVHFGVGSDPDAPIGVSPLEPLAAALGIHDAIARHLFAFFAQGARPSVNLKAEGANKETLEYLNQLIREQWAGPENAGKPIATSGDVQAITATAEHSGLIDVLKITREEACAVYAVAPPLVGILDRAIMSNVRELRDHHARETLGPYAAEVEGEIAAQLLPMQPSWRGLFAEHDFKAVLAPSPEQEADILVKRRHMESIDEQRKTQNLPPFGEPWSRVPWGRAGEAPADQMETGTA